MLAGEGPAGITTILPSPQPPTLGLAEHLPGGQRQQQQPAHDLLMADVMHFGCGAGGSSGQGNAQHLLVACPALADDVPVLVDHRAQLAAARAGDMPACLVRKHIPQVLGQCIHHAKHRAATRQLGPGRLRVAPLPPHTVKCGKHTPGLRN